MFIHNLQALVRRATSEAGSVPRSSAEAPRHVIYVKLKHFSDEHEASAAQFEERTEKGEKVLHRIIPDVGGVARCAGEHLTSIVRGFYLIR